MPQLVIDRLQEEIVRLKARWRYQERTAQEGPFGSSTPSAKGPLKTNAPPENPQCRGGDAKPGHSGHGHRGIPDADVTREESVPGLKQCPYCGSGHAQQPSSQNHEAQEKRSILAPRCSCRLLPAGRLQAVPVATRQPAVGQGGLWAALHQLARRLAEVPQRLLLEYRRTPVKHADETGWRNDGHNGYAGLFCTPRISLFRFRQTRSASAAQEVLGTKRLPGTLVVDRYNGYNRAPCSIQYGYAHLLREVQDLGKEFPEVGEVSQFVGSFAPLLAGAMKLRARELRATQFHQRALELKAQIQGRGQAPAQHPGIQKIQNLFREKAARLYHWTKNSALPADNNRAERELRPLVIARKISFGAQSEQGAQTREILMSVLHALRKRTHDVFGAFKRALDAWAEDQTRDPCTLLFDSS